MNRHAHIDTNRSAAAPAPAPLWRWILGSLLAMMLGAGPGAAQTLDADFATRKGQVRAGLAALGLATAPPAFNSLLFLERVTPGDYDFASGQLGAWGRPSDGSRLYLEGFAAAQRYTPDFALEGQGARSREEVKWTSVSATGGIGWDFALTQTLSLRPIVNVSLGRITSNSELPVPGSGGPPTDFIAGDAVEAAGFGGALALDYAVMLGERQIEARLRHSRLRQVAFGASEEDGTTADTIATSAIARLRQPIGNLRLAGRPVRSVLEATYARYDGDTGEVLDLPWIARIGTGLEFETGLTGRYTPPRVRMMVRYVFGENFDGIGFGAGLVF